MRDLAKSAQVYLAKVDAVAAAIDPEAHYEAVERVRATNPDDVSFAHLKGPLRESAERAIAAMYGMGNPEIHADTANTATLVDRLRGIYRIPITDGLGPAGGDEPDNARYHVRHAVTNAIQHAAANRIEKLEKQLAAYDR